MNILYELWIFIFFANAFIDVYYVDAKTIRGVFSSLKANAEKGQYLSSFCFHGDAVIQYAFNASASAVKFYLFLNEDWKEAAEETDCQKKLEKTRNIYDTVNSTGNKTHTAFKSPRIWHIVLADSFTCSSISEAEESNLNFLQYEIQLFNPDALGNPVEHFSDEETGLLRFYQLLALAYFVLGCICVPKLWEPLWSGGPMQLVIQLLTASTGLQAVGALCMIFHLQRYSKDGSGSPLLELIAEFFDVLSQFAMLYMLLSLSLGWTLGTSYKNSHLQMISQKPAARVVGVLGVLQGLLFLWEQYQDQSHRLYHAHRTTAGQCLVILRIALATLFAWNLYLVVSAERSMMKKEFYISFTMSCMLWFLCYPVIVIFTLIVSEYLRYKLITMSVVLCQSVAVVMLYRLFLSRSLYWEVSALSSSLPLYLKFDNKNLGLKIYS
ncbi:hypothetical protein CHS0354_021442 [Potamilus streckersoni]|uniref:Intimal thickness related receptor IRP domain-containing protein n=1 Tax=Potamilus streckersoni TaxID=2493646 RepID=A0AAE0S1R5_9BIVA|nr:hypothetical protein CHS0354_021442 [Potamilus streckersoni]